MWSGLPYPDMFSYTKAPPGVAGGWWHLTTGAGCQSLMVAMGSWRCECLISSSDVYGSGIMSVLRARDVPGMKLILTSRYGG